MSDKQPPPAVDSSDLALPPRPTLESASVAMRGTASPLRRVALASSKVVMFFPLAYMLLMWWTAVLSWYVGMHVVFGIFFLLFHLFRRVVKHQKQQDLRHREMLQATQSGDIDLDDLESEKVDFAGPMTFTGAYRRTRKIWMSLFPES